VRTLGRLLSAGGRLVFTCEALEAAELAADARALAGRAGWSLTPSGRYAHARRYIEAVASAAGLELRSHGRIVPRVDKGREVGGHLFVLGKP
jgi:predicted TPR repeat methyltransferase